MIRPCGDMRSALHYELPQVRSGIQETIRNLDDPGEVRHRTGPHRRADEESEDARPADVVLGSLNPYVVRL